MSKYFCNILIFGVNITCMHTRFEHRSKINRFVSMSGEHEQFKENVFELSLLIPT